MVLHKADTSRIAAFRRGQAAVVFALLPLAACVATPVGTGPGQTGGITAAPASITVGARDYVGGISPGQDGLVLTPTGAEAVTGASVKVFRPGLTYADGLEAKAAAKAVCERAGGAYDSGAMGRFETSSSVAAGDWIFDGSCQ